MQQHLIQMGKPVKVMRLVKEGVVDGNHILNKMKVFPNHRSILEVLENEGVVDGTHSLNKMGKPAKATRLVKEGKPDPEIQKLKVRLSVTNSKLLSPELHDDRPEKEISPSPELVYNNLIKKNSTVKAAPDYKLLKLFKKLCIQVTEYPTYNFIGLIMGPRGNTQKKHGKGSAKAPNKLDISDGDELHVLVEAGRYPESLNVAVKMVEKLLIPIDEGTNDHKRAQLEELAKMNGTYRGGNVCSVCKEVGHKQYSCPRQQSIFKMAIACEKCGSFCHFTPSRPLIASPQVGNSLCTSSGLGSPALPSQFPGYADYPRSQLLSYSATPILKPSPPLHFSQTPDGSSNPYWPPSRLPW
ncbi:Branchpoint-bridging protein [Actinidia chinensis var. chinensis]|uniref:Branchpoint-bridging protein n=1 Tax=Actinidia chinensis var. chinensis TaxID=1590841 RepID=A0A2R6PM80_ACTCC|nr:Branchpoint-bridging protein [Actinidia chinensis var. chinensis]